MIQLELAQQTISQDHLHLSRMIGKYELSWTDNDSMTREIKSKTSSYHTQSCHQSYPRSSRTGCSFDGVQLVDTTMATPFFVTIWESRAIQSERKRKTRIVVLKKKWLALPYNEMCALLLSRVQKKINCSTLKLKGFGSQEFGKSELHYKWSWLARNWWQTTAKVT